MYTGMGSCGQLPDSSNPISAGGRPEVCVHVKRDLCTCVCVHKSHRPQVVRYGYKAGITLNPRNEMQDTAKGEVENLRAPPGGQP